MNKIRNILDKFSQSFTACMIAMVQGDLSVISVAHAQTASKTGVLAAAAMLVVTLLPEYRFIRWFEYWLLGVFTAIADYMIHDSHFGTPISEALATGMIAVAIAIIYDYVILRGRYK